jgi:hypothetical protein
MEQVNYLKKWLAYTKPADNSNMIAPAMGHGPVGRSEKGHSANLNY